MNEDLMREAGMSEGFATYRNLTVDNGKDIAGTGATGDFIETTWNDEKKQKVKKSFGKKFKGVLLFSRAVITKTITDKNRNTKRVWESEEFNPLLNKKRDGTKALIPIYQFDFNGMKMKTPDGKFDVKYVFYEDISSKKKQGNPMADYVYKIILYVLVLDEEVGQKEVVKLSFKGASRGNFFKYQQDIWRNYRVMPIEIITEFSTYLEKSYNKFAISFSPIIQEDGQPLKYPDIKEVEDYISELLNRANQKKQNIPLPTMNNQFVLPTAESQSQIVSIETERLIPKEDNDNDILLEDIPF